jgi:WD40 repeat protein
MRRVLNSIKRGWRDFLVMILALQCVACLPDKPINTVELATRGLYTAAFSQDGRGVVVSSLKHGGSYWTLHKNPERAYNWNHARDSFTAFRAVALSRDNRFALTAEDRRFVVWNTHSGKSVGFWDAPGKIIDVALSDGGAFALVALDNYQVVYVDVMRGGFVSKLVHESPVSSVAISVDGGLGVAATEDGKVRVWVLRSKKVLREWAHPAQVSLVSLAPSGKEVFTFVQHHGAFIWHAEKDALLLEMPMRGSAVTAARFHDQRAWLLMGTSTREVLLWDWGKEQPLARWLAPSKSWWKPKGAAFFDVAFLSKTEQIVSVASNGALYYWPLPTMP